VTVPEAEPQTPALVEPPKPRGMSPDVLRVVDGVSRVVAYVVSTALAVLLALVEAFLLPMRVGPLAVPFVSFALAVVANAGLIRFARYATGSRLGIVAPCIAWIAVLLTLSTRTAEGDLVMPGDWRGLGLLFIGAGVFAVTGFLAVSPPVRRLGPNA
jgi:hypothetical protein